MDTKIQARVWLNGKDDRFPIIADVINPGGWFGKTYVLQIAIANNLNPFFVVEADSEQSAIDTWADDEQYGHFINDDEAQEDRENCRLIDGEDDLTEWTTAGNDSHCVDLDNVAFCKVDKIEYFVYLNKENHSLVAEIADVIEQNRID